MQITSKLLFFGLFLISYFLWIFANGKLTEVIKRPSKKLRIKITPDPRSHAAAQQFWLLFISLSPFRLFDLVFDHCVHLQSVQIGILITLILWALPRSNTDPQLLTTVNVGREASSGSNTHCS